MKLLKYSFLSILVLLLIMLGGLAWIVSSEAGLRFLKEQAEQWAPGELKIDTFEGRLLDKVSFTGLSYQYEETALHIESFLLSWESIALLDMKLHVQQLHIKRVELDLPQSETTEEKNSEPFTLPEIQLPVQIALDDVQIKQVIIRSPDVEPFIIDSIELRSTTSDILSLQHLQVESPLFKAKVAGDVGLVSPHKVEIALDWSANLPEFTIVGQGKLNGDMQKLTLNHTVSQPLAIEIKSTVRDVLGALKIDAMLNWQEIYWPFNTQEHLVNSQQGYASLSGSLENYQFDLKTRLTGKDIPAGTWKISAQGNQQALTLTKLHTETLQGVLEATGKVSWKPTLFAQIKLNVNDITVKPFWQDWPNHFRINSELVAELDKDKFKINRLNIKIPQNGAKVSLQSEGILAGEKTRFKNAVLNWQGLKWPLAAAAKASIVSSKTGRANISGTVQNYKVDLNTQLAGADIPESNWAIKGQGNLEEFQLKSLHSTLLKGVMKANGKVSWQPKLVGQLKLNVNKISVKKFWKDWPNHLRLNSELLAKIDKDNFKIKLLKVNIPQTGAKVSLQSEGILAGEKTSFKNTVLNWQGLQWPLVGNSLVNSKTGRAHISGTVQNYQVYLDTQLAGADIPFSNWSIKGQGNLEEFQLQSLHSTLLQGIMKANGKVSWKPKLVGQLKLNVNKITINKFWKDWPTHLRLNSELLAEIDQDNFKIKLLKVNIPQTGAQLSLQGEGQLAGEKTRFNSKLKWKGLQWPLVGDASLVNSQTGSLEAKGTAQAYQLRLATDINGKDIPAGHWQAVGLGNSSGLNLKSLQSNILKGDLNLKGQLHWQPMLDWKLTLKGKNLNFGSKWPEVPSKIALYIRSKGSLKNGDLKTQVQIKHLQGHLRNYPLQLKTAIIIDKDLYQIKHLNFKYAKNRFTANGKLGKKSRLNWRINAPNLAVLLPELKGNITGKGRVTGPVNLPHLTGILEAKSLVFQDQSLKTFKANIDVNLFTQKRLRLDIVAKKLLLGATEIERVSLTGKGSFKQHTLIAKLKLPTDSLSIALKGGLKPASWQGQLKQLKASTAMLGNWNLQTPSALILSATEAKLAHSCVQRTRNSKICTQLHWQPNGDSTVQVSLKNLSLNLARAFLDPHTIKSLTGELNATLNARLDPKGVINSDVLLKVSPGFLTSDFAGEQKIISYKGGAFKLTINQKGLAADWKFGLLKRSSLQGNFKLPGFTQLPLKPEQIMTGKIKMIFNDFSILPTFVPQIENSQGKMNLDVTLKGSLDNPKVAGLIAVKNAALNLPASGLELKKFNATLRSSGNDTFKMLARVSSGKGQLKLMGKAKLLSATDWTLLVNIAGKNFEVVNIPAAWVLASPDLNLKMAPGRIDVTGKVSIPKAEITPPSMNESNAVAVSEDVVIINPIKPESKPKEKEVAQKWAISSKVKIILGKQVRFEGAGFKTHFGGRVIASNQPGEITLGNGELHIIDGSYKAYGQNLKIDRGRVFFAGGPIENPGLDIKAYRKIKRTTNDVIAGIHIQGTAQSPKLTLFSKPPFDQSNTLSYIILGKPIANASESEGNTLVNALASLSLQQGDSLTKEIGQTFGLDTAGIDTEDGLDNAAMVVGKYLTPGLYISYGVGLFDGLQTLRMRYELTKKLTLETETSTESGVDLRYSWER